LRTSTRLKQISSAVTATVLGSLVSVAAGAAPATAVVGQYTPLPRTSLAYTDSLAPKQSLENPTGDMPLGSWADSNGATHFNAN